MKNKACSVLSKEKNNTPWSSDDFILDPSLMRMFHPLMKDERNVARTTSLIFEAKRADQTLVPIFTLKPEDYTLGGITFYSLRKIYFSYDHVPEHEYQFALDVFGSWDIWVKLTKCSIRQEFQDWRDELDIRIKCKAIEQMMRASKLEDARGIAASKYLADRGYISSGKRKAGRPSREEVARELKIEKKTNETLTADMERIGLTIAK